MSFSLLLTPLLGLAGLFGFAFYTADPEAISVEPIHAGEELHHQGYLPETLSAMLVGEINAIQQGANTSRGNRYQSSDKLQEKTAEAMGETLQITKPVKALQLALGLIPLTISGSLVEDGHEHQLMLTGYTSGGKVYKVKRKFGHDQSVESMMRTAGLDLMEQLDLYVAANAWFKSERKSKDFVNSRRLIREGILKGTREDLPWFYNLLGRMLHVEGRYDEAIAQYQRSLEIKSDFPRSHLHWGRALNEQKKYTEALAQYAKALRLDPGYADVEVERAITFTAMGEPIKAMQAYAAALALDPHHGYAYYKWGQVLASRGETVPAIEAFRRAVFLEPKDKDFQTALDGALGSQDQLFKSLGTSVATAAETPTAPAKH